MTNAEAEKAVADVARERGQPYTGQEYRDAVEAVKANHPGGESAEIPMRPDLVEFAEKEIARQIALRRVRTPQGLAGLFPGLGTRKR